MKTNKRKKSEMNKRIAIAMMPVNEILILMHTRPERSSEAQDSSEPRSLTDPED